MRYSPHFMILAALSVRVLAQDSAAPVDRERRLWNTEFQAARTGSSPAPQSTPKAAPVKVAPDRGLMLGLTTWRMRESRSGDKARLLVHESNTSQVVELTPERMQAGAELTDRDRVRISVEPGRSGNLYIASREVYADGSRGDAYLLFPSRRIRAGSSKVNPGELVEVPEASNAVPYFTLKRSRPEQVGEELMLLLSQDEIRGLIVERGDLKINPAMVAEWLAKWGSGVKMLDSPEQKGAALTTVEQRAGADSARLRPEDPLPQLLFHVPTAGREAILALYTLRLK